MRYNWHRVAENGPLPARFRHSLACIRDESTKIPKVYAVGTREEEDLEIFELDSKLESWIGLPFTYDSDHLRNEVKSIRWHEVSLAGVGRHIYVFGRFFTGDKLLKFDIVERKWYSQAVIGCCRDTSSKLLAAGTIGETIVLLADSDHSTDVFLLDTAKHYWISPKILGTPPSGRDEYSCLLLDEWRFLVYNGDKDIWFLEVGTQYVQGLRKAGEEVCAWSKGRRNTIPIVICGPSGVGKGTLIGKLMQEFPDKFGFSVSHTTRKPREKEVDGVHYHFTSRDRMELAVRDGEFLEHANVHGNMYGTSIAAVEAVAARGKRCILDIDVQGAKSVRQSSMEALFIFILPPSFEELERRLRGRGTETEDQVTKRLQNAKRELELAKETRLFDHVLVNDDLDSTYEQLKGILGLDNVLEIPTSLKLVTGTKQKTGSINVHLVDASTLLGSFPNDTHGLKWHNLEPSESQLPLTYKNEAHLSDLEILMTGNENDCESIVLRLVK